MSTTDIINAIEKGSLSDAKENIYEFLMNKIKEALADRTSIVAETLIAEDELQEEETEYEKFFRKALKKFGVSDPSEFKNEEEKKKFFNYIDKEYKSDVEKSTGKEDPDADDDEKVAREKSEKSENVDIDIAKENEKVAQSKAKLAALRKKKQSQRPPAL